ncbi:MAG: LLM class flavin-dependent oxidoreductase [Acidimicrobiia bacterium]|nr:LLM class flavin-dependent oxidoreductase [bacterium]MXX00343.1 LLM class flavin-dependent oxidoreductase [Acidimicrobiia bacterium]MDE0675201.1 LLM class flavin-dependent oxidoreductase [bacterium]MXX46045.1 LLM class flavin-dependent oxidoreductase [Acidimicrobiia bacterium]MXY74334.1 LLM class flavin-dependent oxidoreductase [Acidimicrobiia bacterium]
MEGLRFGVTVVQSDPYPVLAEKWRYFEELGFDSLWHCDHLLRSLDPTAPLFEGWTLLAALAAETSRIRVGTLVSSNVLRHPALLAQQAITVDHISEGRLEVGIGCGWFEEEHRRFGIPLFEPGVRVDRFSEAMVIIDRLLRGEPVSHHGRHYELSEARLRPRPVQRPRPPFTVAAHGRRMLRICARFGDRWNSFGTVEEIGERNRILDAECDRIGRDPTEISRSVHIEAFTTAPQGLPDIWSSHGAFTEVVGRYAEAGANEFTITQPGPGQYETAERIASEVIGAPVSGRGL